MSSLVSSSRFELRRMVIGDRSDALMYDVTKPKATVALYASIYNRIYFVILNFTQVHQIALSSGNVWGEGQGAASGWHCKKRRSVYSNDIHHAGQGHLLLTVAAENIHKTCLLGYIVLHCFRQLD